ncbi:hypothetical protein SLS56_011287 [Neofusicoccum ribis]|uniref:RING-type domain-containing protein n=1 Tax=Neofusicoccum ribis TaxID=45134 RepID=A0ABR3SC47_9PEZI
MDARVALRNAKRTSSVEHLRLFFPKYDDSITSKYRAPLVELAEFNNNEVEKFIGFLDDPQYKPLTRLMYIPITSSAHTEQATCALCNQAFTTRIHVPVKMRCGCIYGESCVMAHLSSCVRVLSCNAVGSAAPGQAVVTTCPCPTPWCKQPWVPLHEWAQMRRHHPGHDEQSWLQEFEWMHKAKFLDIMWARWVELALNTPEESRTVIIIRDDKAAIATAHLGIMCPNYRKEVAGRQSHVWGLPIVQEGFIVNHLAKFFEQLTSEVFNLNETTIKHFTVAIVSHWMCHLHELQQHYFDDETVLVLRGYTDRLIKHTPVLMRINMKMLF